MPDLLDRLRRGVTGSSGIADDSWGQFVSE
jgi:hypothetical protein